MVMKYCVRHVLVHDGSLVFSYHVCIQTEANAMNIVAWGGRFSLIWLYHTHSLTYYM